MVDDRLRVGLDVAHAQLVAEAEGRVVAQMASSLASPGSAAMLVACGGVRAAVADDLVEALVQLDLLAAVDRFAGGEQLEEEQLVQAAVQVVELVVGGRHVEVGQQLIAREHALSSIDEADEERRELGDRAEEALEALDAAAAPFRAARRRCRSWRRPR